MTVHKLYIPAVALLFSACGESPPPPAAEQPPPAPAEAPAPAPAASDPVQGDWRSQALIKHMHAHADQLDEINFALADGNLEDARTPAHWLSQHRMVDGVPQELTPYLLAMQAAAAEVETAATVEEAQDAAARINDQCQGCHDAAGVRRVQGD